MSRLSLHHEDRLRPVTRVGDDLWFFSTLDGCLYGNAPQYIRQALPSGDRWFLVPGDESAHRIRFDGRTLGVERSEFATGRWPMPNEASEHIIPGGRGLVPMSVVATEHGSRSALLQSADGARTTVVELKSGRIRVKFHRADMRVARILDGGATVLAGNGRFEVTFEDRAVRGVGTIAATTGTRVLIREESRSAPTYRIASEGGDDPLRLPSGWSPIQAAFATGDVVMTCLHSAHGYGLWRRSDGTVRGLSGTPQLFPLGEGPPALRVTGISTGSVWLHGGDSWPGTAAARPEIPVQPVRIDGMPCLHLRAPDPRALVLAFHGGPDSHEWDDLRYGGTYRTLVDRGIEVLIVNAAGSAGLGLPFQRAAWKRWPEEASRAGRSLARYCQERGIRRRIALGVSFGAWFAAIAADAICAAGVVALAPILRLAPHLEEHSLRDPDFAVWAAQRFGGDYQSAAHGDDAIVRSSTPVLALIPEEDEVVERGNSIPRRSERISIQIVPGNHYPRSDKEASERWATLVASVERLVGAD